MIDPSLFLSSGSNENEKTIELEGSFSCPEEGCYETTTVGKFDQSTRIVVWTCINGHKGKASI